MNPDSTAIQAEFNRLADDWRQATRYVSAADQIVLHRAYQQIIGMGRAALPLILERLEAFDEPWSWALQCITREDPVPPGDRGVSDKVRKHWLDWARLCGFPGLRLRGFKIVRGVLAADECDALLHSLASASTRTRAGARHLMSHPAVGALAVRPELLALAGPGAVPYRATLFEKAGGRNWLVVWHQDTTLPLVARNGELAWGPWSEKDGMTYAHAPAWALERIVALRVHLDASTPENGPLRVIPGTHRRGVLTDDEVFRLARESDPVEVHAARGDIVVMRPLLIHASSKARSAAPRRVLHLEYADTLDLAPGIRLARA